MHYVMIGNSIASTACIEAIRTIDTEGPITVIGEENHPCYSRPLISYVLQGKTDEARLAYRAAAFYEENSVTVLQGIRFFLGDSIRECTANEALLQSGSVIGFDLLVIAVGVKPNIQLAKETGLDVNHGILVDEGGRTSNADVFAAGDCTEGPEMISGQKAVLALLPNAYLQGETAGTNMAGGEACFDKAVAMNALSLMGLHLITVGRYEGTSHLVACEDGYKRLFVKDNHLVGCILVGEACKRAGIYTAMIRNKVELDSLDFTLICEEPLLMAFAKNVRQQHLGGPV